MFRVLHYCCGAAMPTGLRREGAGGSTAPRGTCEDNRVQFGGEGALKGELLQGPPPYSCTAPRPAALWAWASRQAGREALGANSHGAGPRKRPQEPLPSQTLLALGAVNCSARVRSPGWVTLNKSLQPSEPPEAQGHACLSHCLDTANASHVPGT